MVGKQEMVKLGFQVGFGRLKERLDVVWIVIEGLNRLYFNIGHMLCDFLHDSNDDCLITRHGVMGVERY